MAKKTKFKRKIDDFKTKKQVNYLTISILTSGKNKINRRNLSEKTSSAVEFWRNVYVCCGVADEGKFLKQL